ncbi:RNA polymerase sigma factor [Roseobacter sp.]|uniref:RNA polymerase sigma factor n=1 Tax=Roseobacter sp. TaxID=1907202 RepID=UPI0032988006
MLSHVEQTVSDDALLALFAEGASGAARTLTGRLLPRVYAHAVRMLGDPTEAEDAAQEAMMKLWRIAPDWRPGEAQVSTWLYRVTANLCTDRLRKRRGVPLDDIAEPADPQPGAVQQIQDQTRYDALQSALNQLPERQRQAVVLRHIEGLSNPEIAHAMEIGPRAVESLTARGKRALTDILAGRRADLGYEDDTAQE